MTFGCLMSEALIRIQSLATASPFNNLDFDLPPHGHGDGVNHRLPLIRRQCNLAALLIANGIQVHDTPALPDNRVFQNNLPGGFGPATIS